MIEEFYYNRAKLRHLEQQTICVIGDSHVNFFSGNENLAFVPIGHGINTCETVDGYPYLFTPLHLGPALAYQCINRDSSTAAFSKLEYLLQHFIMPGGRLIFALGEIDLRVHVFKHADLSGDAYKKVVDDILANYAKLLLNIKEKGYRVSCWGPIATQPDLSPMDEEYPRTGTEVNRNRATKYFNDSLKAFCHENDIVFMSVFYDMTDESMHTNAAYLSNDMCHLGQAALPLAIKQWDSIKSDMKMLNQ